MDFINICLDEIALEGLDGITIAGLWVRLENRKDGFPIKLDVKSKQFLWKSIVTQDGLDYYKLQNARPLVDVKSYARYDFHSSESGTCQEIIPKSSEDVYPIHAVKNVFGSCATYDSRKLVNGDMRGTGGVPLTLHEVLKKFTEHNLVIVANLQRRQRALYGPQCPLNLVLSERQYMFLERIGRSRQYGEVTHVRYSLMSICENNSKAIFYIKKILTNHGLIKSEPISLRTTSGQNTPGFVLHLSRYHVKRIPILHLHLEKLCKLLQEKPNHMEVISKVREAMNLSDKSFKKLTSLGSSNVKFLNVKYRHVYPDASPREYRRKGIPEIEKQLRMLKLIKMYKYVEENDVNDADDDEEEDDMDEEEGGEGSNTIAEREKYGQFDFVMDRPVLKQVYDYVLRKGPLGVTQKELSHVMGLGKLESRLICRNLQRMNVVKMMLHDAGRQRVQTYVARQHEKHSVLTTRYEIERKRILEHAKVNAAAVSASNKVSNEGGDDESKMIKASVSEEETLDSDESVTPELASMFVSRNFTDVTTLKKKHGHVTFRVLKRANMVIEAVKEAKILDRFSIQKKIIQEEDDEGLKNRLDRKSLERLIERLAREGQIKSIKTVLRYGKTSKQLHFICHPTMANDDPLILSAIEQAKRKHISLTPGDMKEKAAKVQTQAADNSKSMMSFKHRHISLLPRSTVKAEDLEYDSDAGKRYGYLPKMKRLQTIHEMISYLVYHYEGNPDDASGNQIASGYDGGVPIYKNEMSWKRYVPLLPKHKGCGMGWCLISDLILITPVSLFCKVTRLNYKIPGLLEYLMDPVKKFTLIRDLPTTMQAQLYYGRKYIFSYYEKCVWLCQMGLLTFGPREMKEKDQIFIYLHKKASIVDTTSSQVAWNIVSSDKAFPVKGYSFDNKADIDKYWFDLQCVCINTPLGAHQGNKNVESKAMKKEDRQRTYQRLLPCQESRTPEQVQDEGRIPGDGLGAGGMDSSFFSHLKRNWTWNPRDVKFEWLIFKAQQLTAAESLTQPTPKAIQQKKEPAKKPKEPQANKRIVYPKLGLSVPIAEASGKSPAAGVVLTKDSKKGKKGPTVLVNDQVKSVQKVSGKAQKGGKGMKRKAQEKKFRVKRLKSEGKIYPKKPYYDADDRQALCRMTKERVEWSVEEDSLLLLCKVTALFLGNNRQSLLVPWKYVRDVLHEHMKCSRDKTSKACQRRVMYVMKNETTRQNVMVYLAEIMQDQKIVAEFRTGKIYKRTDEADVVKAFRRLLPLLKEKFSSAKYLHNAPDLPYSVEELQKRYTLSAIGDLSKKSVHCDVSRVKDIYASVVHNLIHSVLSLADKIGRALELYKLFSQYPERLLDDVFSTMNRDGIITKIKGGCLKRNKDKDVNMLSIGSYQMAQRYDYVFMSRYPKTIFLESVDCLDILMERIQDDDTEWMEATSAEIGGHCAAIVTLMALNKLMFETEIPEKVIVVDTNNMNKQIVGRGSMMKPLTESDAEDEELIQLVDREHNKNPTDKKLENQDNDNTNPKPSTSTAMDTCPSDASNKNDTSIDKDQAKAITKEPPNTTPQTTAQSSTPEGSKVSFQLTSKNASRIMMSLVHGQYLNTMNVRYLNPQDHLVVNACRIKVTLKHSSLSEDSNTDPMDVEGVQEDSVFEPLHSKSLLLDKRICKRTLDELRIVQPPKLDFEQFLDTCRTLLRYTDADLKEISEMYKQIREYKSLGMTNIQFKEKYRPEENALKHLHVLICHRVVRMDMATDRDATSLDVTALFRGVHFRTSLYKQVLRVGVTVIRYVSFEHSRPWLIHSYKNVKGRNTGQDISNENERISDSWGRDQHSDKSKPNPKDFSKSPSPKASTSKSNQTSPIKTKASKSAPTQASPVTSKDSKSKSSPETPKASTSKSHQASPRTPQSSTSKSAQASPGTPIASTPKSATVLPGTPIASTPKSATVLPGTPIASTPKSATVLPGTPIASTPKSVMGSPGTPKASTPKSVKVLPGTPKASSPKSVTGSPGTPKASTSKSVKVLPGTPKAGTSKSHQVAAANSTNSSPVPYKIVPVSPSVTGDSSKVILDPKKIMKIVKSSPENLLAQGKSLIFKVPGNPDGGKKKILLLRSPEVLKSPVVQSAISTTSTPTTSGDSANQEPVRKSQRLKEAKNAPKKSPPPQGNFQKVKLVIRPWKTPEGTVNRNSLKMMLESVLTFIMAHPGSSGKSIFTKYNPILQPVPVIELLEILEEIGCVTSKHIKRQGNPGIFNKRCNILVDSGFDPRWDHYYESLSNFRFRHEDKTGTTVYTATVDCILKMGQYIAFITQNTRPS